MCNKCYKGLEQDIPTTTRADLNPNEMVEDDESYELDTEVWDDS